MPQPTSDDLKALMPSEAWANYQGGHTMAGGSGTKGEEVIEAAHLWALAEFLSHGKVEVDLDYDTAPHGAIVTKAVLWRAWYELAKLNQAEDGETEKRDDAEKMLDACLAGLEDRREESKSGVATAVAKHTAPAWMSLPQRTSTGASRPFPGRAID